MKRYMTIGIILVLGSWAGLFLTSCGKKESIPTAAPVAETTGNETVITNVLGPNLYINCWKGMTFMTTSKDLVQVIGANGRPLECVEHQ